MGNGEWVDKVHQADVRSFCLTCPPSIVDLTVTSPPYCVDIKYGEYNDGIPYEEYLSWLESIFSMVYVLQKDHSYIAVNIGRDTEHNTPAHMAAILEKVGFKFYKRIIWQKPQGAATQTFWYKYPHPRYYEPYLVTEDILVYTKGEVKGEFRGPRLDILEKDFIRSVANNVWEIMPESEKVAKHIHPAPFPLELPSRLIQLLSLPGDVVFDPFAGSGTTLLAAKNLGRHYIGTDIDKEYCEYARMSLAKESIW